MDEREIQQVMQTIPLLSHFKMKYDSLYRNSEVKVFPKGAFVVKKGDIGSGFYLILEGHVQIKDGQHVLGELGRRQYFGEMSLFDEAPRSADVVATMDTQCLIIPKGVFMNLLKMEPDISIELLKELSHRLRENSRSIQELARNHRAGE